MKKALLISFLFLSQPSFSQLSIDSLKTEADIENFVTEYGNAEEKGWEHVSLNPGLGERRYSAKIKNLDSLIKRKWIIMDFNNDSRKDLIFNGEINGSKSIFSLISSGNAYLYSNLSKKSNITTVYSIDTIQIKNAFLLIISTNEYQMLVRNKLSVPTIHFYADTLLYKFGGFIGYKNSKRKSFSFDSLSLTVSSYYLKSLSSQIPEQFSIQVLKNGVSIYKEDRYDLINGANSTFSFQFDMTNSQMAAINNLVALFDINSKDEYYSLEQSHASTADVKISVGEKTKKVSDFGMMGTYELKHFYKTLFSIIKEQRIKVSQITFKNEYLDNFLE